MYKQKGFKRILFSPNKQWYFDMSHNMGEPWKYYAKWSKPDTKGQIDDSTSMKYLE